MAKGKKVQGGEVNVKVTDGGSLEELGKKTDKTAGKFDQFGKSAHSADRAGRGVAQMSSNQTKNFSKLSQGITGGLVPAYATLAAQLFALDALFRFLKDAADFRVLQEGQTNFAAATGVAYKSLARDIQMATDAQITYADASQAAAIGMAAGLNAGQMIELSEAAKTVSIALGRDTTDSFNRLVRGVTKAEPELLDELGIVLRLEQASIRYAAALGKNKNELTTFEKSQAVANEVLRQAEEKFGAMNELAETNTNAIAKMAIAFDEVMNKIKVVIGPIAEFFGSFLARNIEMAGMAIGVFASSMVKKLLPAVTQIDVASRKAYLQERFTGEGGIMSPEGTGTPGSAARFKRFQQGKETKADIQVMKNALKAKESQLLKYENFRRGEARKTLYQLRALEQQHIVDQSTGFRKIMAQWRLTLNEMKAQYGAFVGTVKTMSRALGTAVNTALGVIGWLGMALMAGQMAIEKWGYLIWGHQRDKKEFVKFGEDSAMKMRELHMEMDKIAEVAESGALKTISQQIAQVGNAMASSDFMNQAKDYERALSLRDLDEETFQNVNKNFGLLFKDLQRINPELKPFYQEFLRTGKVLTQMNKDGKVVFLSQIMADAKAGASAVKSLEQANQKLVKAENDLIQALPKLYGQKAIDALREKVTALEELVTHNEEEYKLVLKRAEIELKIWEYWSKQNTELSIRVEKLKQIALLGKYGLNKNEEGEVKTLQQMAKIQKMIMEYQKVSQQITNKELTAQQKIADGSIEQLRIQKELLNTEMARMVQLEAGNDAVFSAWAKLYEDFNTNLGKAIGKALRGEKDAFAEIGKNMLNTLTDAVGQSMANMMMEHMIPDKMKPHVMMRENMESAMDKSVDEMEAMLFKKWEEYGAIWKDDGKAGESLGGHIHGMRQVLLGPDGHVESLKSLYRQQATNDLNIHNQQLEKEKKLNQDEKAELERLRNLPKSTEAGYQERVDTRVAEIIADPKTAAEMYDLGPETEGIISKNEALKAEVGAMLPFLISEMDKGGYLYNEPGGENTIFQSLDPEKFNAVLDEIIRGAKAGQGIASGMGDDALSFYTDKQNDQWTGVITNRILDQVNELMPSEGTADYNKLHEWLGKEDGQITFKDLAGPHGQKILDTLLTARSDELREILADAEGMETTAIRSLQSDVSIAEDIQKLEEETVARDNLIAGMEETTTVLSDTVESLAKAKAEVDKTTTDPASTTTTTGGNGDGGGDGDGKTKGSWTDGAKDFKDSVGAFSSGASFILGAAGRQEEAAKVMKIAAMIIMTVAIMERAQAAMDTAGGSFGKFLKHLILPPTPGRYGGVMNSPGYRSFSSGGIAQGPQAGYGAVLHGTEAVVPLGNDRSIPVEMKGSGGNINNTSVTVNMETGSVDTKSDAEQGKQLGQLIQATVTQTISNEQRSGGLLDTGGGG